MKLARLRIVGFEDGIGARRVVGEAMKLTRLRIVRFGGDRLPRGDAGP